MMKMMNLIMIMSMMKIVKRDIYHGTALANTLRTGEKRKMN